MLFDASLVLTLVLEISNQSFLDKINLKNRI